MSRKYEQSKRAEQQEETRQRIVRAAIELHGSVGPAQTSVSAVAERAGVQRNTFYRHFPDERTLLHACSGHFTTQHPLPDPAEWADEADPQSRVRRALGELYAYWEKHQRMVANVLRDAEVMDVVREVSGATWGVELAAMRQSLVAGWPKKARTSELEAVVELALSFRTWQSLVEHNGLNSEEAADLMARVVADIAG